MMDIYSIIENLNIKLEFLIIYFYDFFAEDFILFFPIFFKIICMI